MHILWLLEAVIKHPVANDRRTTLTAKTLDESERTRENERESSPSIKLRFRPSVSDWVHVSSVNLFLLVHPRFAVARVLLYSQWLKCKEKENGKKRLISTSLFNTATHRVIEICRCTSVRVCDQREGRLCNSDDAQRVYRQIMLTCSCFFLRASQTGKRLLELWEGEGTTPYGYIRYKIILTHPASREG